MYLSSGKILSLNLIQAHLFSNESECGENIGAGMGNSGDHTAALPLRWQRAELSDGLSLLCAHWVGGEGALP